MVMPNFNIFLDTCITMGEKVHQDYKEAAKWYRKAAEQGNAEAQEAFGGMYYYGWGVPKDYKEAAEWYLKVWILPVSSFD